MKVLDKLKVDKLKTVTGKDEKFCPKCGEAVKKKELCKCNQKEGYADKVIGNILRK